MLAVLRSLRCRTCRAAYLRYRSPQSGGMLLRVVCVDVDGRGIGWKRVTVDGRKVEKYGLNGKKERNMMSFSRHGTRFKSEFVQDLGEPAYLAFARASFSLTP